jgi:hypothetical protein
VANATGFNLQEDFAVAGLWDGNIFDGKWLAKFVEDCCTQCGTPEIE